MKELIKPHRLYIAGMIISVFLLAYPSTATGTDIEVINLGNWTEGSLNGLLLQSSEAGDTAERINFISGKFLDTPYQGATLTGDQNAPEVFTINLAGMDCFTYIDYVQSLAVSGSFQEFEENLKKIRYRDGVVGFQNRNHFFSDWPLYNSAYVRDVTREIGGDKTKAVTKNLNRKSDGTAFLPGIPVKDRTIYYIPSSEIDDAVLSRLRTGDYVGIYADIDGLDISHNGIVIKKEGTVYLRHASSRQKNMKVVDEILPEYIQNKPGLVVYRQEGEVSR